MNHTKKPLFRRAPEYIVTAPIMSIGNILMGVFQFLPLEDKVPPISMKIGDASLVGSHFTRQLPDTRTEVAGRAQG